MSELAPNAQVLEMTQGFTKHQHQALGFGKGVFTQQHNQSLEKEASKAAPVSTTWLKQNLVI